MKPTWEPDWTDDLRGIAEPYVTRWLPLLPTWVQEFCVRYDPEQDSRMAAKVNYRNRWAVLIFTGQWFQEPEAERDACTLHEFLHIAIEPAASVITRVVEDLTEDKSVRRQFVDSMYSDGMEASVEDMARGILRLVGAG